MSVKYRSRAEIISAILQAANGGATRTRIMYGAYLSYSQVTEYLELMVSKDLLRYDSMNKVYGLTEKSLVFNRAYDQIRDMDELTPSEGKDEVISVEQAGQAAVATVRVKDSRPRYEW